MSRDQLGDRMKGYEQQTAGQRLMPLLPVLARLDGKCFSQFTKGLARPFDERLSELMMLTTERLVKESNALLGYTQSDEITLLLYSESLTSSVYFEGKVHKLVGDLAALASVELNHLLPEFIPEKVGQLPRFDCRVWNVPSREEAVNTFLWRESDATKNSIQSACRMHYSHKQLFGKPLKEMQELLFQKGTNWDSYPDHFKRGTYIRFEKRTKRLDPEELEKLPPLHEARKNPDLEVEFRVCKRLKLPPLTKIQNRVGFVFLGEEVVLRDG